MSTNAKAWAKLDDTQKMILSNIFHSSPNAKFKYKLTNLKTILRTTLQSLQGNKPVIVDRLRAYATLNQNNLPPPSAISKITLASSSTSSSSSSSSISSTPASISKSKWIHHPANASNATDVPPNDKSPRVWDNGPTFIILFSVYYHSIKPEKVTDVSNLIDHYQERIDGGLTRMQTDMENKYKKNPIQLYKQTAMECGDSNRIFSPTPWQVLAHAEHISKQKLLLQSQ